MQDKKDGWKDQRAKTVLTKVVKLSEEKNNSPLSEVKEFRQEHLRCRWEAFEGQEGVSNSSEGTKHTLIRRAERSTGMERRKLPV